MRAEEVKIYHVFDARSRSEQILDAQGDHPLTGLGAVLRRETVNPGFPYKGSTLDIGYEYVGALGGEYHFHKINATFDDYVLLHEDLLDRKTVLRFHLAGDYIPGEAPFFERYYGGGIGSIRGFRYRGVSPRDGRGNDPVGGDFAFTGTVEVNFPIYQEMLRGVVFSDFGDVESQVHIGTIRSSLGAGVRIQLPLFGQVPLAIDFAVPMNKGRQDNTQLISFSLGWSQ
jgi:outer membrane protein insertion porin family